MSDTPRPRLVAYYRVSTVGQGQSGLGVKGQIAAVQDYARQKNADIIATYEEVESGKRDDRPELARAIGHARRSGATLVIAKWDRISRRMRKVCELLEEAGLDFVACDNPHANRLTIHILAAVAEDEARRIGERTRAALGAYRAGRMVPKAIRALHPDGLPPDVAARYGPRAGKLGAELPECRNLTPAGRARGNARSAQARAVRAVSAYADLGPEMVARRREGQSWAQIARDLNGKNQTTPRGKPFGGVQVRRIVGRFAPELLQEITGGLVDQPGARRGQVVSGADEPGDAVAEAVTDRDRPAA